MAKSAAYDGFSIHAMRYSSAIPEFFKIDEWTSCSFKRYLNVTVHSQEDSYKLGLISIEDSCDSYKVQS